MIQTHALLAHLYLPVIPVVWSPSLLGAGALPSHPIAALPEAEAPWGQSPVFAILLSLNQPICCETDAQRASLFK